MGRCYGSGEWVVTGTGSGWTGFQKGVGSMVGSQSHAYFIYWGCGMKNIGPLLHMIGEGVNCNRFERSDIWQAYIEYSVRHS